MLVIKPLGEHELFLFFLQFTLLLLVARTMGEVAVRLKLPSVVGELLGGFVLGPSLIGAVAPGLFDTIFPASASSSTSSRSCPGSASSSAPTGCSVRVTGADVQHPAAEVLADDVAGLGQDLGARQLAPP